MPARANFQNAAQVCMCLQACVLFAPLRLIALWDLPGLGSPQAGSHANLCPTLSILLGCTVTGGSCKLRVASASLCDLEWQSARWLQLSYARTCTAEQLNIVSEHGAEGGC